MKKYFKLIAIVFVLSLLASCSQETKTEVEPPVHEHDWVKIDYRLESCMSDGYEEYKCNECGKTYKEILPMIEHEWSVVFRQEPTCSSEGFINYACPMCPNRKHESIPKLEHNPSSEWSYDEINHWHSCECDKLFDVAEHKFTSSTYSLGNKLVKEFVCDECNYSYTVEEEIVNLDNVIFADLTVVYDSNPHSIYVLNLPLGCDVSYEGNNVSEIGTHKVVAKIYYNGEFIKEITAQIIIKEANDVELPLV